MKASELIKLLQKYPGDTRVLVWDQENFAYAEPELKIEDLIIAIEFGAEKICPSAKKWQYSDTRTIQVITIR
ncbi:hypothetical protein [Dehalogenimonas etheniformans]|uniref:Uncharacterized protein n=1 Tax=Dehalogenimonas etheniformans TaxID=1536648 RepID=A0A2P5PAA3_9CHLR|nr:hypothetical protein [Dehalogenimonas etheniformans]PPD59222.1 hypothetical protein JP09_000665 [Dehalogenimonas etheniformans]QNT75736.1 hypothetical protein HX448_03050 [Dehalogenimonas etheniformans]